MNGLSNSLAFGSVKQSASSKTNKSPKKRTADTNISDTKTKQSEDKYINHKKAKATIFALGTVAAMGAVFALAKSGRLGSKLQEISNSIFKAKTKLENSAPNKAKEVLTPENKPFEIKLIDIRRFPEDTVERPAIRRFYRTKGKSQVFNVDYKAGKAVYTDGRPFDGSMEVSKNGIKKIMQFEDGDASKIYTYKDGKKTVQCSIFETSREITTYNGDGSVKYQISFKPKNSDDNFYTLFDDNFDVTVYDGIKNQVSDIVAGRDAEFLKNPSRIMFTPKNSDTAQKSLFFEKDGIKSLKDGKPIYEISKTTEIPCFMTYNADGPSHAFCFVDGKVYAKNANKKLDVARNLSEEQKDNFEKFKLYVLSDIKEAEKYSDSAIIDRIKELFNYSLG